MKDTQDKIEIQHNRKNHFILSFASIIGISACGFLMYVFTVFLPIGPIWTTIVLTIVVLFFVSGLSYSLYLLFKKEPALIISDKGITDNTIHNLQILWTEIADFKTVEFEPLRAMPYKIILINLKASERYIHESKLPKRILLKYNKWYFKTPIILSPKSLKCSIDELEQIIKRKQKNTMPNST